MKQPLGKWRWSGVALAAVPICAMSVSCSASPDVSSEAPTTTVSISVDFDPCTDLGSKFVEEYQLKAPGTPVKEPLMSLRDAAGCRFERSVSEYSEVVIALNDARLGSADELEHPPRRKLTIGGRPAEMLSWHERPGQAGKPNCSIQIQLATDSLYIFYSDGLLQLPDEDYSCRQATKMGEDLVQMIERKR